MSYREEGNSVILTMSREDAPEGYHYEWVPDESWTIYNSIVAGRKCRSCGRPAVAALKRRHRHPPELYRWWRYCESHLYGRKIEDGIIKVRHLVKDEAANSGNPKYTPYQVGREEKI